MPQFLRDERHERVQQLEGLAEHKILDGQAGRLGGWVLQLRFRDFHVPVTKIVPEKSIQRLYGGAKLEPVEAALDVGNRGDESGENRMIVGIELGRIEPCQDFA